MWRKTGLFITFAMLLCCCAFSPSLGLCSEEQTTSPETLTVSKADWDALRRNNAAQKQALLESQQALNEAKQALTQSQEALSETKAALLESQTELTAARQESTALLKESTLQKQEIERLRKELTELRKESLEASSAISTANQYLQDTRREIMENEATWRKRENQLERQRLLWQLACVIIGGVAATT